MTYKRKADHSGGSARCRICTSGSDETVSHIVATCQGLSEIRVKILPEFHKLCTLSRNKIDFENICQNQETLTQFILDPTSLNLSERLSLSDPMLNDFFKLSRSFCYKIDKTRIELLNHLEAEKN